VLQLNAEDPEALADMGVVSLESDTYIDRVIQRFVDRDRQKSIAERTKLISLLKQHFAEYRAMLDAYDELTLADKDAAIRRLKREREEIDLKNQLADLQHVAATRGELRPMEAEKQKLTLQHEVEQLKKKVVGGENGPYREGMRDKRARRMFDIEDDLFEALEHPIQTEMDARVLYKKLRQKIDRHPDLTDEDKDEMLERLKQRFGQLFKHASTPIFEED
jgi:DNA repair exonuclease SbcCD ATPase subunit